MRLFIGCVDAYSHDVPLRWVLLGIVVLLILATAYVRMERGRKYPMLPFDLLRIPIFTTSVATSIVSFTAQMLVMVGMPFMLVDTFGYNAVGIGLLMTAWPLFQSPNNHLLLSSAPPGRTSSASGMLATVRLTGQTIGAALVAMLFHLFGPSAPHDALLLGGCLTICGAICSCLRLKEKMPTALGAE